MRSSYQPACPVRYGWTRWVLFRTVVMPARTVRPLSTTTVLASVTPIIRSLVSPRSLSTSSRGTVDRLKVWCFKWKSSHWSHGFKYHVLQFKFIIRDHLNAFGNTDYMFKFAFELELRTKIENAKIAYLHTVIILLKCAMLAYYCMIVLMFFYLW